LRQPHPSRGENEIETALKVIDLLDVTDRLVTADALHCHTRMADAVVSAGGDYLLALKGNRRHWYNAATAALAAKPGEMLECGGTAHGRLERRRAEVIPAPQALMPGHKAFVRITSQRDAAPAKVRLYMASMLPSPRQALEWTRAHWQVENGLHWMLDVHLREDLSRARTDNAPANVALINRIARNILQDADTTKVPISHRIRKMRVERRLPHQRNRPYAIALRKQGRRSRLRASSSLSRKPEREERAGASAPVVLQFPQRLEPVGNRALWPRMGPGDVRRRLHRVNEALNALEQRAVEGSEALAIESEHDAAHVGGDVVEALAQVRLLQTLGIPIGHDSRFDTCHLAAQPFHLVFKRQLVGQQHVALGLGADDEPRGLLENGGDAGFGIGDPRLCIDQIGLGFRRAIGAVG